MLEHLPHLAFLPVEDLVIHEWHDEQRTPPLIERIRASGVLRNPPIVAPLQDKTGRHMVLDGANRVTALRKMGFPHALVQIVQPGDPGLKLENWNHVVWGIAPRRFYQGIDNINGLDLVPGGGEQKEFNLWEDCGLGLVQLPRGDIFTICTQAEVLVTRVNLLNAVVDSYKDRARLDRTNGRQIENFKKIYPDLSGLVIFPHLKIEQVMQLASAGFLLPSGITRFTVSPRALHVNYPLQELASHRSIEKKNEHLQCWVQDRIARKGVRYYAEATFLFDE